MKLPVSVLIVAVSVLSRESVTVPVKVSRSVSVIDTFLDTWDEYVRVAVFDLLR